MNESLEWMKNPKLKEIPTYKLEFLQKMFFESKSLQEKERLPFLLSLAAKSKSMNISFSEEETSLVISVLKEHASAEDVAKIDRFIRMAKSKS
ncbi:MAG: hypothetical protein PUB13_10255 [Lachnospiraceae bacterium]|nr:hypothetical protein [Lachnospiraceae bacterium]